MLVIVTRYEKKGHPEKILDMPFLVSFASPEFCAHSHIFVLFMRISAETQWPPIFRHPGNSEFENGTNEIIIIIPYTLSVHVYAIIVCALNYTRTRL